MVKLAKNPSPALETTEVLSDTTRNLGEVEILQTDVGFLRVREEPNTSSEVVGQVNPGERYDVLEENSGWYKIEVELIVYGEDGGIPTKILGWVSGEFAKKLED